MTKVIFEGAGWSGAKHNGVGNCRIRGVFTRTDGKHLYLEMGGRPADANPPRSLAGLAFPGRVDHSFMLNEKGSQLANEIRWYERSWSMEYTRENILKLLKRMGIDADDFEVLNDGTYSVFEDQRYINKDAGI